MTRDRAHHSGSGPVFDELLVVLVQGGDRRAAERLYIRWHPRLARTARKYCGDAGLAEQLAQDCWVAVWKGIGGLKDASRFGPWVFGIMRREGADHVRMDLRNRLAGEVAEGLCAYEPAQDDAAAIRQAFAALPPDQRLAAHLHFVEGLTLNEIAEVAAIPVGTAKSRLFHARRKLKAALSETDQGETS